MDFDTDLALARDLMALASEVALRHFRRGVRVSRKDDGSQVTYADLEVESAVLEQLSRHRPGDAVLTEESGAIGTSARILDPIDGTSFFVAGRPEHWGPKIALAQDGEIVVGVVACPVEGRCWWASRGGGAHTAALRAQAPERTLRTSATTALAESTIMVWAESNEELVRRSLLEGHAHCVDQSMDGVMQVAEGRLDLMVAGASKPWDLAPGVLMVEEAGGHYCDPAGGRRLDLGEGWYSNGFVHKPALELLGRHAR